MEGATLATRDTLTRICRLLSRHDPNLVNPIKNQLEWLLEPDAERFLQNYERAQTPDEKMEAMLELCLDIESNARTARPLVKAQHVIKAAREEMEQLMNKLLNLGDGCEATISALTTASDQLDELPPSDDVEAKVQDIINNFKSIAEPHMRALQASLARPSKKKRLECKEEAVERAGPEIAAPFVDNASGSRSVDGPGRAFQENPCMFFDGRAWTCKKCIAINEIESPQCRECGWKKP